MKKHPPASVLILARSEEIAQQWAQILRDHHTQTWLSAAELSDLARLDLILTDGSCHDLAPDMAALTTSHAAGSIDQAARQRGRSPGRATEPTEGLPCSAEPSPYELASPPDTCWDDRPGWIVVGGDDSHSQADVCLPADVTPRELGLACRLLAEVVRLRRALLVGADSERRLAREALTDPLTGLPNRRAWDRRLGELLAPLPCPAFCLAILDLDRFKQVNDTWGHAVGDQVLRTVARTLGQNLRQGDFVARLGGDEFGLLLPLPDPAAARRAVERVRRAVPAGLTGAGLPGATASAGLRFSAPSPEATPLPCPDALLAAADAALRAAKASGRDRTEATEA